MSSFWKNALIFIIAPIVVSAAVWFFFQREYVDLQYSLSEPLPTKFLGESRSQTIQQLTILNRGNVPATEIKIEINGEINRFDLQKNVATDSIVIDEDSSNFHAVYDSLSVGSKVKLVFELDSGEITSEDVVVSHSKGAASEILSDPSGGAGLSSVALVVFPLFYLVLIYFEFRSNALANLKAHSEYRSPQEFLSLKKPTLLKDSQWQEARNEYIRKYRFSRHILASDLESTDIYYFLNTSKPDYFSDSEWLTFLDNTRQQFSEILEYIHSKYIGQKMLEDILLNSRPEAFPKNEWDQYIVKVSDSLVSFRLSKIIPLPSLSLLEQYVVDDKPEGINENSWLRFSEAIKSIFYVKAAEECFYDYKPVSRFESLNKSLLADDRFNRLSDLAYRCQFNLDDRFVFLSHFDAEAFLNSEKPEWLRPQDIVSLEKKAEIIKASYLNEKEYKALLDRIEKVFHGYPVGDKPEAVCDRMWRDFVSFYTVVRGKIDKLSAEEVQVSSLKSDVSEFKKRLSRQLSIIDQIFSDPSYIDKIEDFDNPFAQGNFENLRKVSEMLKTLNK